VTLSDTVSSVTSNNVSECVANIDSVLSIVDCRKSNSVLLVYMLSMYTIIIHLLQCIRLFQTIDCSVGLKLY